MEGTWRRAQGPVKGRPRVRDTDGTRALADGLGPILAAALRGCPPRSAVSPPAVCVKRVVLTLGLLALAVPALAQSTISPGGARAEARLAEGRRGVASYYAASLHGRRTASGERYDRTALTAAHRTLPFGTLLRVESERSGRRVLVRVNDRGPFARGRALDLSGAAADRLRMRQRGTARVRFEIVDPAGLPSRQAPPPRKVRHL